MLRVTTLQKSQTLTATEKKIVSIFKEIPNEHTTSEIEQSNLSFEEEILRDVERSKNAGISNEYRSTFHVSPTSNIVECLFSITGIIMRPHLRYMDPWSLELLIMLRANKGMWGYGTLQAIIDRRKEHNRDAAIARTISKRQREDDGDVEEDNLESANA